MLNDIQKRMMTRMLRKEEREDWRRKGGLQRQRDSWWKGRGEVIDFCSLWCLWYLCNHAATLIQPIWFNCTRDNERSEGEHRVYGDKECQKKRGGKEQQIERNGKRDRRAIGVGVQMRTWRKSFPRCWWMNVWKSRTIESREQRSGGGEETEREAGVKMCQRQARHHMVLNHMSLIARHTWLQPALSTLCAC